MKKAKLRQTLALLKPRMPEIGKIKIGGLGAQKTAQSGRKYRIPVMYDHFIITTLDRDSKTENFKQDKEMHEKLGAKDGKSLKEIPIKLLYNDIGANFPSYLACYKGSEMICNGDGEHANRKGDGIVECPCDHCEPDYDGENPCKMNAVLTCVIQGTLKIGAVHKFRTCSVNAIQGITSSLAYILSLTRSEEYPDGVLFEIPLKLVISKKQGTNPKTGKKQSVQFVRIEFDGSTDDLIDLGKLIGERTGIKQLAAPEDVNDLINDIDAKESEDITAEYYPDDDITVDKKTSDVTETSDIDLGKPPELTDKDIPADRQSESDLDLDF